MKEGSIMEEVTHFYRKIRPDFEYCFNIETSSALSPDELKIMEWLLAETFEPESFGEKSFKKIRFLPA